MSSSKPTKWHRFDEAQSKAWFDAKHDAGVFNVPFGTSSVGPLSMPGALSFLGSNVQTPIVSSNGMKVGSEWVALRIDGTTTKAYAFMMGTSTDKALHYAGPYKNFPAHHVRQGNPVACEDFFGHTPVGKTSSA